MRHRYTFATNEVRIIPVSAPKIPNSETNRQPTEMEIMLVQMEVVNI